MRGRPPVYLLGTRLGWQAEVRCLGDLASADLVLEPVHPADPVRMAELVARYVIELATTDRRHFGVVRPAHAETFALLP